MTPSNVISNINSVSTKANIVKIFATNEKSIPKRQNIVTVHWNSPNVNRPVPDNLSLNTKESFSSIIQDSLLQISTVLKCLNFE